GDQPRPQNILKSISRFSSSSDGTGRRRFAPSRWTGIFSSGGGSKMRRLIPRFVFVVVLCFAVLWPFKATAQLNSNSFSPVTWYPPGNNANYSVAIGDLNSDGFPDLVVSTQCHDVCAGSPTGIFVHINNGDGTFHFGSGFQTDAFGASPWESVAIAYM